MVDSRAGTGGVVPGERPTPYPGQKGSYVKLLQEKLRGMDKMVDVDGDFGSVTTRMVKNIQGQMKLKADGVVGGRTWAALDALSRGGALSPEDEKRLVATYKEGKALRDAGRIARLVDLLADHRPLTAEG